MIVEPFDIASIDSLILNKWKQDARKEGFKYLLIFHDNEEFYSMPCDTVQEIDKTVNFYSSIDFFVGKIDLNYS